MRAATMRDGTFGLEEVPSPAAVGDQVVAGSAQPD